MVAFVCAFLLLDSEKVASNFDKIKSLLVTRPDKESAIEVIHVTGLDGKRHPVTASYAFEAMNDGAGSNSVYVLSDGKTAFYRYHVMSRVNDLVVFTVKGQDLLVSRDFTDTLFDLLPKRLVKDQVPDNVAVENVHGDLVKLNFVSRDERDGIKATFQVKGLKWTLQSAKYWRDKGWNGVRNF